MILPTDAALMCLKRDDSFCTPLSYKRKRHIEGVRVLRWTVHRDKLPMSSTHRRCDLGRSESKGATAPSLHRRRFFCARDVASWRWCAGHLRVCRAPFVPVGQPAYCCHLNLLGRERWQFHNERNSCMTTGSPSRILASALRRLTSPAPEPHRFYPIHTQGNPKPAQRQVPHD